MRKRLMALSVLVSLAAPLLVAQVAAPGGKQLMEADRAFAKATAERRAEGWTSFFAENAMLPRREPVVNKEGVRADAEKMFADPGFTLSWEPTHAELFPSGDLGYTVGRWESRRKTAEGEIRSAKGTYLTVWQKQKDGSWKIIYDNGAADPE